MDWPLLDIAKDAEDVASGLQAYVDDLPGYERDLLAHISALFAISAELRSLEETIGLGPFRRAASRITAELHLLCGGLELTLQSIRLDFFALRPPSVRRAWESLCLRFEKEGRPLGGRLVAYNDLAVGLSDVLRGDRGLDDLDDVMSILRRLQARQIHSDRYDPPRRFGTPVRPISRRNLPFIPPAPDPGSDDWSSEDMHSPLQEDLHVPVSPTFSNSSFETYSSFPTSPTLDPNASLSPAHWATRIFDGQHSVTPFRGPLGQPTRCLGGDMPSAVNRLFAENFHKVLEQPFDAAEAFVRLYWRPTDHRARLLFLTKGTLGQRYRYCIPLTALKIQRVGMCLQLCRVNQYDGGFDLWGNLRFMQYERMVLFYCTAVAMKRQDAVESLLADEDFFQPGEEQEFGGEIEDDRYLHAFRVFRDRDTGAVRFEATARRGPMHKTPIWTAFVTQYIGSRAWMRRAGPKILSLSEFHPYVFCDNYKPPRGRDGKFELRFRLRQDCEDFMETFHNIGSA